MTERDPVAAILEHVEHPVAPDRAFAQALLGELLGELGDDEGHHRRTVGRLRRSPGWRKAITIAAAFAIATAGLAMLQPFARPTVLPASVSELGPFPLVSFRGTVVAGPVDQVTGTPIGDVTYASQFSWKVTARGNYLYGGWGYSFGDAGAVARDGDIVTFYSSRTNSIRTLEVGSATVAPTYSPARRLTWTGTLAFSWATACVSGTVVGDEFIGGIQTVRVHCPEVKSVGGDADVWVDPSDGIVLRIEVAQARRSSSESLDLVGPFEGQRWDLTDLQVGEVTSATYTPPSDAIDATNQTVLSSVRLGQPMPTVELPLIGGGTTTLGGTPGRPTAIYFWDLSCEGRNCSMTAQIEALAARDDVDVVVVVDPTIYKIEERVHDMLDPVHVSVPIALDASGAAADLIEGSYSGGSGGNTLLLFGADGNLEGVYAGDYTERLPEILDALASGDPLPQPGPRTDAQLP
jgi:hypothetical protein